MKLMSRILTLSSIASWMFVHGNLAAVTVNDGSSVGDLVQLSNVNGVGFSSMTLASVERGGNDVLIAAQSGQRLDFPLRTVWYSDRVAPGGIEYGVEARFQPAAPSFDRVGGVMGWLNLEREIGIALLVTPAGDFAAFEVATVDFQAAEDSTNQSLTGLFNPDGSPASALVADQSARSSLGEYDAEKSAVFRITFTTPTEDDRAALEGVTARLEASVRQDVAGDGTLTQVGNLITLLTNLPVPDPEQHAFGYFAYFNNTFDDGTDIGWFDDLDADGNVSASNALPEVALTSPAAQAEFTAPANIRLTATASDSDGSIAEVQFFAGNELIGTDTESPFEFVWSDVLVGMYGLTARAVDDAGGATVSGEITVNVVAGTGTGDPPDIHLADAGDSIEVSWDTPGFTLQFSTSVINPAWTNVSGSAAGTTATVPKSGPVLFFRLIGSGNPPDAPALTIGREGSDVVISWDSSVTGFELQSTDNLLEPTWSPVPSTNNRATQAVADGNRLYRLLKP